MQSLSSALVSHLAQETKTLATCWSITRRDGVVLYFTEHDQNITVDGHVHQASSGMSASAVTSQSGLALDNLEFEGMLNADAIREADLLAGRYDHAKISVFMVNYQDPDVGKIILKTGWLGEVTLKGGQFVAEMRGLSSKLQQTIGEVFTGTCRAMLGDVRCAKDLTDFTKTGTITAVEAAYAFTDSSRTELGGYFDYDVIQFTSGANSGLSMEIKDFSAGRFSLFLPMPYAVSIGDTYSAIAGCDKTIQNCISQFNNALNFRGEPHVPGMDKLLETAATRSV